jgi:hypothetical protein
VVFRRAIEGTPSIKDAYGLGLQALPPGDRERISVSDTRNLKGSINIDSALKSAHPNAPRWDYGVAFQSRQNQPVHVFWIEVHPARTLKNRDEVSAKLIWLRSWLTGDGKRIGRLEKSFVWICRGKSTFTATSPTMRALAESGLQFSGRNFRIT